jgi:hypothetical protein
MAQPPLRIILVLADPDAMPGWIVRLIERIGDSTEIGICAIAGPVAPRRRKKDNFLFRLLYRLELAAGAGTVSTGLPMPGGVAHDIPRIVLDDHDALGLVDPDVILDLSGNHGVGISTAAARHGVWFTDATGSVPGIAGLRPLLEGRPVSSINLFRRSQAFAMATAAVNIKFIAARNEAFLEEKSVTLILRELKRLARGMPIEKQSGTNLFVAPCAPGTIETLAYLSRMVGELARRGWQKFATSLGFRPGMFGLNLTEGDPLKFKPALAEGVNPPRNCFHADPFFWQQGDETWCFFETFDYRTGLGYISAGQLESGRIENIRTVLEPGYHLSFPFLFEHQGQLFMMPESCASRRIELWRCTAFPDKWELHKTALEGTNPADSTLAEIDGQYWLFTNICDDPFGEMNSELHLFRADSPMLEKLEPHPLNPVLFDSRCARNAGRIFQRDGVFYRPAQDNSHGTYGYGLHMMRIEELSMERYIESSVRHIAPTFKRGIIGCHHIDILDDRIIFDVRYGYGGRG